MGKIKNKNKVIVKAVPNNVRPHPEPKGCCSNPDWRSGIGFDYCKNCGENNY